MWPGRRKQAMLLSASNARGLLASSYLGKLYSGALRRAAVPYLGAVLGPFQSGALKGRGTDLPIFASRLHLLRAKNMVISCASI